MVTYTIIFQNNHGSAGNYAVFAAPPTVSDDPTQPQVYTNVWIPKYVPTNGNFTVKTTEDIYAWVGSVPSSPAPGVTLESGTSALATLGTTSSPGSAFPMTIVKGEPTLGAETLGSKKGAFRIDTGSDFPNPNDTYLIGMGKVDAHGIVTPTGSTLAVNGMKTNITPIVTFYIGVSSFEAGTIVDFQSESASWAKIDFSSGEGLGKFTAVVTQENDSSWTVTYMTSTAAASALEAIANDNLQAFLAPSTSAALDYQKLASLETQIAALTALLKKYLPAQAEGGNPLLWLGKVRWPATVAIGVVTSGATIISTYLASRNYTVSYKVTTNPDQSKVAEFTVKPPKPTGNFFVADPVTDWNNAVAADTQPDHHVNLGITEESLAEVTAERKPAKKGGENTLTERTRQAILNGE